MSKNHVIVHQIRDAGLSVTEAANQYKISRQRIYQLLKAYDGGSDAALEPRSRKPHTNPRAITEELTQRIIDLRKTLTANGLDAGPLTIQYHLNKEHLHVPSTSTIRRILRAHGLVKPEPKKRPKSSLHRFQADQPNETWQSDFTEAVLASGHKVEILHWLDDHSRYLLHCSVHDEITTDIVIDSFTRCVNRYGPPQSTLTDNGLVYTTRLLKGLNKFEKLLITLGIRQKNGTPYHPQTQGKVERFHHTEHLWVDARPRAQTIAELQTILDQFQHTYNTERPHRALNRETPEQWYHRTLKARPNLIKITRDREFRIRHDRIDNDGKVTLRHDGKLRHLGVRKIHRRKKVVMLIDTEEVTVLDVENSEVLSRHVIDPDKFYWPDKQKSPGRWPGESDENL
ncbi:IS481 family transposase [Glutamicibacter mishrai]|uniref:IS481 family transposase n=1 Tax=Glutamicibacter mishrai TaxID=1775880 RepID=UPI0032F01FE0